MHLHTQEVLFLSNLSDNLTCSITNYPLSEWGQSISEENSPNIQISNKGWSALKFWKVHYGRQSIPYNMDGLILAAHGVKCTGAGEHYIDFPPLTTPC